MLQFLVLVIFPAALIFAAINDIATMTISNWVSIILVVSFGVLSFAVGMPLEQIGWHLAAGALVLVIGFALFACNILGGGDAKLLAAAALWVGWSDLFALLMVTAFMGAPLCIFLMVFRAVPMPEWMEKLRFVGRLHNAASGVPYGVAICGAGLLLYPETPMMQMVGA